MRETNGSHSDPGNELATYSVDDLARKLGLDFSSLSTAQEWDPAGYSVDHLARDLGFSYAALSRLASKIDENGYRQRPERVGRKTRVISAPSGWLKPIQRRLADTLFLRLPISERVYSQRGCNVVQNASQHVGRTFALAMDLSDCYPTTTTQMVRTALAATGLRPEVVGLVTRLVTYHGRLPQGPPTSPAVLDRVLLPLDEKLRSLAVSEGAIYTRYADDLSFSSDKPLTHLRKQATKLIRQAGYNLRERKTRMTGPGSVHVITGIAVGDELHPVPGYITEVERGISKFRRGRPSRERSLRGKISWVGRLNAEDAKVLHEKMNDACAVRAERRARRNPVPVDAEVVDLDSFMSFEDSELMPFDLGWADPED